MSFVLPSMAVAADPIEIPAQTDWTDHGWVLEQGPNGSWDKFLNGMLTASVVKKNGVYYLYYGGACCYSTPLASVTDRAIGVATSTDGINFTKYSGNPVITWQPNNGDEEGAASSAVTLDPSGQIVVYYGANSEESSTTVNADSRLTISSNGKGFSDKGIVLRHNDNSVWGSGDELFPIIAFEDSGTWFQYYLPNGSSQGRKLGVAWGPARDNFTNSAAARDGKSIDTWGVGGGAVKIAEGTYALFLNDVRDPKSEVRTMSTSDPTTLSSPIEVYQWPDVAQFTVLLDTEVNTWFMYYRNANQTRYGVKTAPAAGNSSSSPPSKITGLAVAGVTTSTVDLVWNASNDEDASSYRYHIYRGNQLAGTTSSTSFTDTQLASGTTYSYQVSAVTQDGVEGTKSSKKSATTTVAAPNSPSKVTGLAVGDVTTSTVGLTWNASEDPGSGSYRYHVYRGNQLVGSTTVVSFQDTGLAPGTTYSYQVSAVNQNSVEGPKSSRMSATTTDSATDTPSRVTGVRVVRVTTSSLDLAWNVSTDPNSGNYRYYIYRDDQLVGTKTATSFRDVGLAPGTTYSYQVSAVDPNNVEGPKSYRKSATTTEQSSNPPSKIIGFRAPTVDADTVELSWSVSTDNGAEQYRYRIYRRGSLVGSTRSNIYHDWRLAPNTTFYYQISAVTEDGVEGPKSMKRWATTSQSSTNDEIFADGMEFGDTGSWANLEN